MKKILFALTFFTAALSVLAVDDLVIVGHGSTQSGHFFGGQSVPWQANLIPLVILVVGLFHLFCPRMCWYFKWGWKFADSVEPSALWLFFERLGGVFIIVVAVVIFCVVSGVLILPHK